MRILVINVVYGYGSTGIIVKNLCEYYKRRGNEVYVLYGRGKAAKDHNINLKKCSFEVESKFHHFLSLITGNLYGGMHISTLRIERYIKKIKPDLIHLHCLNGFFVNIYKLFLFLKKNNFNTVLTNHAEFMFTANCGYTLSCEKWIKLECRGCERVKDFCGKHAFNNTHRYFIKMKKSVEDFKTLSVTCVSPWLNSRIKQSPLYLKNKIKTILNPVSMPKSLFSENPYNSVLNKLNKKKVALFVCNQPNNIEKGLIWFYKIAEMMTETDYLFALVGSNAPSNLSNVVSYGSVNNESIVNFYKYADVTLLFSMRETFSMIVAESLCSGTPVCGFRSGGPESIAIPKYSWFFEYGNVDAIKDILLSKSILLDNKDRKKLMEKAFLKFNLETIGEEYLNL